MQAASQPSSTAEATATVTGTVLDTNGAPVSGAQVTLQRPKGAAPRTAVTDSEGRFTIAGLPAGGFHVKVTAPGFAPNSTINGVLRSGESRVLPTIIMTLHGTVSSVHVVATQEQVAQAQVKLQEQQRVLGILPNYYSSYIWKAAPMTPKQKFGLALRSTTDPIEFLVAGGVAGVEQWHNTFPGIRTRYRGLPQALWRGLCR